MCWHKGMFCPWSLLVMSRSGMSLSPPFSRPHLSSGPHSFSFLDKHSTSHSGLSAITLFQYPPIRRYAVTFSGVSPSLSCALFFSHKIGTPLLSCTLPLRPETAAHLSGSCTSYASSLWHSWYTSYLFFPFPFLTQSSPSQCSEILGPWFL